MLSPQGIKWRRVVTLGAVGAMLAAVAPPTGAQAQTTADSWPYVVLMEADPVVASVGADAAESTAASRADRLEQEQDRALARADIPDSAKLASFTYVVNGFSAELSPEQAERVARQPGVARVMRDELRQLQTDTSPTFLGLNARHGAWNSGYTGEGVVVGVIDTGIWPEHPSFADDGSYPEPPADWMGGTVVCDFGDTAHNPDDAPFTCNNKLIGARNMRTVYEEVIFPDSPEPFSSARDYDGHGTHTSSTAAGNRDVSAEIFDIPRGRVSGIAPRAHVAMYSACGEQGCFGSDLADAIDQAVADGVDVINYSIGGGAQLNGPDDIAFLFAADAGVFVATSAGNSGPGAGTVGSPAVTPWVTGVGANTHNRTFTGTVTLGDGSEFSGASVTGGTDELPLVDAADHGNPLCLRDETFDPPITGAIVVCARGGPARVATSRAVFEQGGLGTVLHNNLPVQTLATDSHWTPAVHVTLADGQAIKAYIDAAGADAVATIGAGEKARQQGSVMADFSSRGPNAVAASIIKPDVTAPGVQILAGESPIAFGPTAGAPDQLFQSIFGTSMSSPHVAGVFALIKQAHPDWTPAMAKSAVMTTARDNVFKEDGDTRADPFDMGAGHLDPGQLANAPNSVFNPGLVYDAGFNDYLGFLCDAAPEVFANPAATCAALEAAGIPTTQESLNYPSIGAAEVPGEMVVQRTITNVTDQRITWFATVDNPSGFKVRVSPSIVRLAPGESATVDIRITNVRAPLNEWRFGELTWWGGFYRVESPIAVQGVALDAPDSVSGSGTEGSLSFDIQFGYSGAYTAAAHGLVPVAPIAGSVAQDPDQEFDPADPTGTTAHQIAVSGTHHLRIALDTANLTPPDENIDLDLYLYNADGEEVASSTSGGTAELINLSLPADDTYTLYVHGWQVGTTPVSYELQTWQVPSAAGTGPLEIVSAPTEAVSGQVGTIEVAWSGLTAGPEYLGAVSHTGPDGLLALTLVEVTTG
jgi:subtilisin family serine protease